VAAHHADQLAHRCLRPVDHLRPIGHGGLTDRAASLRSDWYP
jgi:hypothetical protein